MSARHIFASEVPPNLPDGWREAANWHIDRTRDAGMIGRLRRIVTDARMIPFWRAADAAALAPRKTRTLAVLVAGAYAPAENPGEIMARRCALAEKVRALADLIASDPDARHVDVDDALRWMRECQEQNLELPGFADSGGRWTPRPFCSAGIREPLLSDGVASQFTDTGRNDYKPSPSISEALQAMAATLETRKPIWAFDSICRAPWATMREISAETRLVRTLAAETEHIRNAISFDLIALAANVATESNIDGSKARAIWRAFLRNNREE